MFKDQPTGLSPVIEAWSSQLEGLLKHEQLRWDCNMMRHKVCHMPEVPASSLSTASGMRYISKPSATQTVGISGLKPWALSSRCQVSPSRLASKQVQVLERRGYLQHSLIIIHQSTTRFHTCAFHKPACLFIIIYPGTMEFEHVWCTCFGDACSGGASPPSRKHST